MAFRKTLIFFLLLLRMGQVGEETDYYMKKNWHVAGE